MPTRDIVVEEKSGELQRISEIHPSYLALQYPLLFPKGEDGYRPGIRKGPGGGKNKNKNPDTTNEKKCISMRQWFAFRIQERKNESHNLLMSKRLYQQFLVDAYTTIETNILTYLKLNQSTVRAANYDTVKDAANQGNTDLNAQGTKCYLPASFVGGPRYMRNMYLDAMTICKYYGFPDLFITFTCNPKWLELVRFCSARNLNTDDRPEIISRVFKMKLNSLMDDLKKKHILGRILSSMYTIEFQKRGLPHAHILLWMHPDSKLPKAEDIDKMISAEIPNKNKEPELYEMVKDLMIHGPCGSLNMNSPCMEEGKCSKFFPKKHDQVAVVVEPSSKKKGVKESSAGNKVRKESSVTNSDGNSSGDEIKDFFDCRYVSTCEAGWRILKNPITYRSTSVQRLSFHLEGKHLIYFKGDDEIQTVLDRGELVNYMFLAWFELNKVSSLAKTKTYAQILEFFTYDGKRKKFNLRKIPGAAIGRINYVPIGMEDGYYLRVLLNSQTCPECFDDIKTVKGVVYPTYEEACFALGLLDNDQEYIDDIVRTKLTLSDEEKQRFGLQDIDNILKSNGTSLKAFPTMPQVPKDFLDDTNVLIVDEKNYNRDEQKEKHDRWIKSMTYEQKQVYSEIMEAVDNDMGGVFFVYGFGRTGKTFLYKTLSSALRARGSIVLNVASSGIASLLLAGGRTTHSRFGIPINPHESSVCTMSHGSDQAQLMAEASLIIWDEAPMMSKHCFESLDRSLSDIIKGAGNRPFGGKVVVFGGDFRQVLPIIPNAGRAEICMSALNASYLWEHCKVMRLTKNMRLLAKDLNPTNAKELKDFSEWILKVGDGKIGEPNDGEAMIYIPDEFLITEADNPIQVISREVYGDPKCLKEKKDPLFFQERAILCPTNKDVSIINDYMFDQLEGEKRTYISSDSIDPADKRFENNPIFTLDFLNSLKLSGMPIIEYD
ncbi:PREDICTED: uncharacterized protein LOC104743390 [Camelina sativa]|uniref:ATP-dependent DNA helicase n=1 Tax=Camelina sativa TaxID=90675 RepID=A0ABM0VXY1_CAMSA|nr:PREDICTED: uncharacterized protein LOC104743390 [Camelina sativa]